MRALSSFFFKSSSTRKRLELTNAISVPEKNPDSNNVSKMICQPSTLKLGLRSTKLTTSAK